MDAIIEAARQSQEEICAVIDELNVALKTQIDKANNGILRFTEHVEEMKPRLAVFPDKIVHALRSTVVIQTFI